MADTVIEMVVLTGAGVSKESGINTFRDAEGEWTKYRIEDVASPEAFASNPGIVHSFYNARRAHLLEAEVQPNAAHRALVQLEEVLGDRFMLITQNVDDLHERAGSRRVIHMHGELLKARCTHCGAVTDVTVDLGQGESCPTCAQENTLRPHIVWFGEMPLQMEEIFQALGRCSHFIAIGTSGTVYPAALFVEHASKSGATTVELNLEKSENARSFGESIYGPATTVVPQFVESYLRRRV